MRHVLCARSAEFDCPTALPGAAFISGMPATTRLSRQQDVAAGISFLRVARKMLHDDVDWNDGGQLVWASSPLDLSLAPACFDGAEFRFDPAVPFAAMARR
jgi:hypothetical protein